MTHSTIVVNNDATNEGRYLLPRTERGLFEMYVGRIPIFGKPDMKRFLVVIDDELAKIDAGCIKVSRGLREELQQVRDAVVLHLERAGGVDYSSTSMVLPFLAQ